MLDQIVQAMHVLKSDMVQIVHHITALAQARNADHEALVKLFTEQKEINNDLTKRIKGLEEIIGEQYLLGDRK